MKDFEELEERQYEKMASKLFELENSKHEEFKKQLVKDIREVVKNSKDNEELKTNLLNIYYSKYNINEVEKNLNNSLFADNEKMKEIIKTVIIEREKLEREQLKEHFNYYYKDTSLGNKLDDEFMNAEMYQLLNKQVELTNNKIKEMLITSHTNLADEITELFKVTLVGVYKEEINKVARDTIEKFRPKIVFTGNQRTQKMEMSNALLRTTRTYINNNTVVMNEKRAVEILGTNLMEISAHQTSRLEHCKWQGKIVDLNGVDKRYLTKKDIGLGTVTGFAGINCRHKWFPYFEGTEKTWTDKELQKLKEQQALAVVKDRFKNRDLKEYLQNKDELKKQNIKTFVQFQKNKYSLEHEEVQKLLDKIK